MLELVPHLGFTPDVIHGNDWQTGLVPVFLTEAYRSLTGYEKIRSVFTIHNIAYQGMFGRDVMNLTGLPGWLFNHTRLEFHGHFNFLKAGIIYADAINTVSPTYAREIQTAEFGCGLEGLLASSRGKLSGIVNGCDYRQWDPAYDSHIAAIYTRRRSSSSSRAARPISSAGFKLPEDPTAPGARDDRPARRPRRAWIS